jgi:hypothetical protein
MSSAKPSPFSSPSKDATPALNVPDYDKPVTGGCLLQTWAASEGWFLRRKACPFGGLEIAVVITPRNHGASRHHRVRVVVGLRTCVCTLPQMSTAATLSAMLACGFLTP